MLRAYFQKQMPKQWRTMWLLKQKGTKISFLEWVSLLIASIPQSFIVYLAFGGNYDSLKAIPIAACRALKLMRYNQVFRYFETKEIEGQV